MTPQDSYDQIIGSGALTYPWYVSYAETGIDHGSGDVLITGWSVDIEIEDPDDEDMSIAFTVSHQALYDALHLISTSRAFEPRPENLSDVTINQACLILRDTDRADFDAATADEVLQVMVFGGVVYG